jgi:hypothetical protein
MALYLNVSCYFQLSFEKWDHKHLSLKSPWSSDSWKDQQMAPCMLWGLPGGGRSPECDSGQGKRPESPQTPICGLPNP